MSQWESWVLVFLSFMFYTPFEQPGDLTGGLSEKPVIFRFQVSIFWSLQFGVSDLEFLLSSFLYYTPPAKELRYLNFCIFGVFLSSFVPYHRGSCVLEVFFPHFSVSVTGVLKR